MQAIVLGCSKGIGLETVRQLAKAAAASSAAAESAWPKYQKVLAGTRNPDSAEELHQLQQEFPGVIDVQKVDTGDLSSLKALSQHAAQSNGGKADVALLFHAAGVLHDDSRGFAPEKKIEDINREYLEYIFRVNTFGPALALHAFAKDLSKPGRRISASLSARVGSIGDNGIGGWYSYRASKAALNQLVKTASIEMARRNKQAVVCALHPGTVATNLSEPVSHTLARPPIRHTRFQFAVPAQCQAGEALHGRARRTAAAGRGAHSAHRSVPGVGRRGTPVVGARMPECHRPCAVCP